MGISLVETLRNYIIGELHIGHLSEGDRLPAYRELAARWDVDHRAVAQAYRQLEAEGLVEIRERQGVFLREQERIGGEMLPDTARWVAEEVLEEAFRRRIKIPELPEFLRRCTASVKLKCACIESTEDHRVLLCRELSEWFGFATRSVAFQDLHARMLDSGRPAIALDELPRTVREADLLVTTTFHATEVRAVATLLRKPVVAVRMHPGAVEAIQRHLQRFGQLAVVGLDPRWGERVRRIAHEHAEQIRFARVDDRDAVDSLRSDIPVLISRASQPRIHRRLRSLVPATLPAIAPESARELAHILIRLNLEEMSPGS